MGFEVVKKIHVTSTQFTIDNGTLTPTLKVKRHEARQIYKETFDRLYAEPLPEEPKKSATK